MKTMQLMKKKPQFHLSKGDKINLQKEDGTKLTHICMGLNWSAIETVSKGVFGVGGGIKKENVDLDASCSVFDEDGVVLETISFRQKSSRLSQNFILHSGDDRSGDVGGDDGLDNEVIQIDLRRAPDYVKSIWFYLNSYSGQDFGRIPNVSLRVYEGTPSRVDANFAQMLLQNEPNFNHKKAMILGKLYNHNGQWKFESVGLPTEGSSIEQVINAIKANFL